jgi:hypothetical protein
MKMLRTFWDAAIAVDPDRAGELDEGRRMAFRDPAKLRALWESGGLDGVATEAIAATAGYEDFDDFWSPFLAGVGPTGAYCASLDDETRAALREECRRRLGSPEGPFELSARAWVVKGTA